EIMKEHTTMGAETLAAALRTFPGVKFLEMAHDIAASHHERFDGTGYPVRLVGDQIPLCARIVALADVYDALTSKRVYKHSFTRGRDVAYGRNVTPKGRVDAPRLWRHPRGHAFSQSTEGRRWHRSSWPTITDRPAGPWPVSSGWRDTKSGAPPTAAKPSAL